MGSEKYPHKGILDQFANRAFSNGTNAWTDTDHTAYTVSTAGGQGFLQLLPSYVDHILYPTITDAGYALFTGWNDTTFYLTHQPRFVTEVQESPFAFFSIR
jgi:Zn-dependent M16 (insulinase) family peptidase